MIDRRHDQKWHPAMTAPLDVTVGGSAPAGLAADDHALVSDAAALSSGGDTPAAQRPRATSPFGIVLNHVLGFGLLGPVAGMLLFPAAALFTAGPGEALISLAIVIMGFLFFGIGLIAAFKIGAVSALLAGLVVGLLHVRGTAERALYVIAAAVGGTSTVLWNVLHLFESRPSSASGPIAPVLDLADGMVAQTNEVFVLLFLLGSGAALALTYWTRRFRRPPPPDDAAVIAQF